MQSVRSTACAATLYTKWRWLKNTFQSKCQTSNTVHKCSKHICPMHSQSARRTWPKSFPTLTLRLCWYNGRWKTSLCKSGKLDSINPFLKWLTQNEFFSWQKCMFPVKSHFEAVFNLYFNSWQDQKRARQIHTLERVATLLVASWRSERPQLLQKFTRNNETKKGRKDDTNIHVWESKFYIPFQPPRTGIKQSEQFNTIILRILRSRLESQNWNLLNCFPIVNEVSAGVPTPPDSGKTPQLRTSK